MGVPVKTTVAYRLYIWLGKDRFYANRSKTYSTTGRVDWRKKSELYPCHFDYKEADKIMMAYADQHVRYEEVFLSDESEEE